ncbi:sensor histidine kinase [Glutamicibacter arilaitensis]|uniref:sensor histidine kinase n=1 Tax=Glutamicibacter arilaitensis TaxID=256701 RepID=UPI00384BFE1E
MNVPRGPGFAGKNSEGSLQRNSAGISGTDQERAHSTGGATSERRTTTLLPNNIFFHRLLVATAGFSFEMFVWSARNPGGFTSHIPIWAIILVAALGYATLLNTRSPVPGYLTMILLSAGCLFIPGAPTMMVGFLIAIFYMARQLTRRQAFVALFGAVIPILTVSFASVKLQILENFSTVLYSICVVTLIVVAVWASGVALARYEHTLRTERVWALSAREEATAMERLRISRDLHDSVAHSLTAIVLQTAGLRAVQRSKSREIDLDAALADVQETAEQSIRELHRMLGLLRSDVDAPDSPPRGISDFVELIEAARTSGVEIHMSTSGAERPLDPSVGHAAYRVVQESLSNVMRHAGQGAKAYVETHWNTNTVTVSIRSLSGITEKSGLSGGFGLLGLRERVTICGGTLVSGPTESGFLVKAVLPVRTELTSGRNSPSEDS